MVFAGFGLLPTKGVACMCTHYCHTLPYRQRDKEACTGSLSSSMKSLLLQGQGHIHHCCRPRSHAFLRGSVHLWPSRRSAGTSRCCGYADSFRSTLYRRSCDSSCLRSSSHHLHKFESCTCAGGCPGILLDLHGTGNNQSSLEHSRKIRHGIGIGSISPRCGSFGSRRGWDRSFRRRWPHLPLPTLG